MGDVYMVNGKILSGLPNHAKDIEFDNTGTTLSSTNAEDAIKEVNSNLYTEAYLLNKSVGESVASNAYVEYPVDISSLKQQYRSVEFMSFDGATGANYASFSFVCGYINNNTCFVGIRNMNNTAQTLAGFNCHVLCIGKL